MSKNLRVISISLALTFVGFGCAPVVQLLGGPKSGTDPLRALGPGTVFPSIEAAAVDALTYAYLEACATRDIERMRGGTIHPAGGGYSYGEIRVASSGKPHRLEYPLAPQDVARFELYPINGDYDVDRINERASRADRRSVAVVDPLHRPLFILHPSLMVREYHDPVHSALEVADLRQPPREILLADDRP